MCLGNDGLLDEIKNAGFKNAFLMPTDLCGMTDQEFSEFQIDTEVAAVVKAPCMRFDFRKIAIASLYL